MGVACTDHPAGAYVQSVSQGTSAEAAGVLQGDIITAIDGEKVPDFARLTARVAQHEPGDKIKLEVLRGEEKRTLSVTLGSWEAYPGF
jgi:putative serine protease PepD